MFKEKYEFYFDPYFGSIKKGKVTSFDEFNIIIGSKDFPKDITGTLKKESTMKMVKKLFEKIQADSPPLYKLIKELNPGISESFWQNLLRNNSSIAQPGAPNPGSK